MTSTPFLPSVIPLQFTPTMACPATSVAFRRDARIGRVVLVTPWAVRDVSPRVIAVMNHVLRVLLVSAVAKVLQAIVGVDTVQVPGNATVRPWSNEGFEHQLMHGSGDHPARARVGESGSQVAAVLLGRQLFEPERSPLEGTDASLVTDFVGSFVPWDGYPPFGHVSSLRVAWDETYHAQGRIS